MEDIKEIKKSKKREEKSLYRSFLKGMSEVLVLGKKPKTKKFYNYSDALNHDISFLQEDLMEALIEVIKDLPAEKKIELKNKLLEIELDKDWSKFTFELEDEYFLNNSGNE